MPAFQSLTPLALTGAVTALQVFDSGPSPNTVIRRGESWSVKVDWNISGGIAPAIGGEWRVNVLLESMGGGFEGTVATTLIPVSAAPVAPIRNYSATLNIPAGTPPNPGVYKLVVAILHQNLGVPTRMAGFEEAPLVQFYDAA